jgi:hypothetical protein
MNPTQKTNLISHHIEYYWSPRSDMILRGTCDNCHTYFDSHTMLNSAHESVTTAKEEIRELFSQYPCRRDVINTLDKVA